MQEDKFDREDLRRRCIALMKSLGCGYVKTGKLVGVSQPTMRGFLNGTIKTDFKRMSVIEKWIIENERDLMNLRFLVSRVGAVTPTASVNG